MSAPSTNTPARQVTQPKILLRSSVTFWNSKKRGAKQAEINRPKMNRVERTATALVMSLIIVMSLMPQTTPRAASHGQTANHFIGYRAHEGQPEVAKIFTRLQGVGDKRTLSSFAQLRERLTDRLLGFEPEELRMLGQQDAGGRLKDWSPATIAEEVKFSREGIKELEAAVVHSPEEVLDKAVLLSNLTYLEHYYGRYHGELGNLHISVSPYEVIQYELNRFHIGDRTASSARGHFDAIESILRRLPGYLEQQQSNLLAGLKLRSPDKQILKHIMERIGGPDNNRSIRAGLRDIEQRLESEELRASLPSSQREELKRLLQSAEAAYKRHLDFMQANLVPRASLSWPLGRDEYLLRLRLLYGYSGSLEDLVRPAEEALRVIKEDMKRLAGELRPSAPRTDTLHLEVLKELREKPYGSEEELLNAYRQIQQKIDEVFTTSLGLPTGKAKYQPAPPGVPVNLATNWPAPLLSPGDALVLVDTSEQGLLENFIANIFWVAVHEGNPGHAAQSYLFQMAFNKGSAPLCRFLNVPDEIGYVRGNWYAMANIEGWAFYTERLMLTKNLLSREERLAALTGQALRAARVVVDVGMHTGGWSRERAINYLVNEVGLSQKEAYDQVLRYSKIPLQALSYFMGARKFEELRVKYSHRYGNDFYARILSLGPVPPTLIDKYLEASTLKAK